MHHSDQGVEYLSTVYLSMLAQQGVEISVARRIGLWENGYAERLTCTLKEEEVYLNDYEDIHRSPHWAFYHTSVSSETPTFGVRVFDTYGIREVKLGPNFSKL